MSIRRVVITGLGCIAPNGNSVGAFWDALTSGISGLGYISRFDTENLPSRTAGEVLGFAPRLRRREATASARDEVATISGVQPSQSVASMSAPESRSTDTVSTDPALDA